MDATQLAWIWVLLPSILNVIEPATSVLIKHKNFKQNKPTEEFELAKATHRFDTIPSTNPIKSVYIYEPAKIKSRSRSYRQANSDAITSMESIAVTENHTPIEPTGLTEKYNSLETTELVEIDKTVIPLTSTVTYDVNNSELIESKKRNKVIPIMTTDTSESPELPELTLNDDVVETTNLPSVNRKNDIESSTDFNWATESITLSIEPIIPLHKIENVESPEQITAVGISKIVKHTERIMTLKPSKEQKYLWLKETIHNMLEGTMLKRETDEYVNQLHQKYVDLPIDEAHNSIWTRYSRAVVESFVLDFCRNYPHYTALEQSTDGWYKEEEYDRVYNTTLLKLQEKRDHTAIQFAAPVRRNVDIYKAILDTPIGIVQSKCDAEMQQWMCFAEYVVHLADVAKNCEYIWYHAQVHLTMLQSLRHAKSAKDPANEVIAELDSRLPGIEPNNDVNYLFDFILQTLGDLSQRLKASLLSQANLYSLIKELQSEDKLKCLNIDEVEW